MKVAFYLADQNPQRDRSLGITRYTDGLLRALAATGGVEPSALVSTSSYRPNPNVATQQIPFSTAPALTRLIADNLHPFIYKSEADLWHYPKGHLPLTCRYRTSVVGTVHDLILQHYADHYPQTRSSSAFSYWLGILKRSVSRFDLILTVSRFSEAAIRAFCERYRLRCPSIRVTYEGFEIQNPTAPSLSKEDAVVHLASTGLHKGTARLLSLWKQLSERRNDLPSLKLIGEMSVADRKLAQALPHVQTCERLSRSELEAKIARSRALILPSEIEGFGLPAIEAYQLGTPVAYVRGTAVEEVLGPGTIGGFDFDSDSFASALDAVLNISQAEIASKAGELAQKYSWERCARSTLQGYELLL